MFLVVKLESLLAHHRLEGVLGVRERRYVEIHVGSSLSSRSSQIGARERPQPEARLRACQSHCRGPQISIARKKARSMVLGRHPMSPSTRATELLPHYRVDLARIPERLASAFVALGPDGATERFLRDAERRRAGWIATRLHGWLGHFMSDFDINGLLDMYPLHLLSTEQFRRLLCPEHAEGTEASPPFGSLLDVGAGAGGVTLALAPL